jgi:hypothetical protein
VDHVGGFAVYDVLDRHCEVRDARRELSGLVHVEPADLLLEDRAHVRRADALGLARGRDAPAATWWRDVTAQACAFLDVACEFGKSSVKSIFIFYNIQPY